MAKKTMSVKSIRWLVAETLVVVLGILIALGLDDYRTGINERRLAIEYVVRIQDDVDRDLRYLAAAWNPRLKLKRESLESIAPVIRGQSPVPADSVAFLKSVSLGGVMGTTAAAWYTDTTFQDMRATGNLRLIQDAAVRAKIAEYYEMLESEALRLERRFTNYVPFVHSVMPSELREDIDSESLEQFGTDYALERLLTDEFRELLNQEYNLMLFMERVEVEEFARSLYDELESYRISLESR
jgi:hypothetical protein